MSLIQKIESISEFHRLRGLPPPEHPLISLIDYSLVNHSADSNDINWIQSFYSIGLKRDIPGKYRYGQQSYDFDEGLMSFFAPNQILNVEYVENDTGKTPSGWILLFHPDFLWNTRLSKTIKDYEFFDYAITESLFLSEKEEVIILEILKNIQKEYQSNMDKFSQNIIIAQLEVLLNYAQRFYERQFITRQKVNHQVLGQLNKVLSMHFEGNHLLEKGLPTVQSVADELNLSPTYLSNLLKVLTGLGTQQHIHEKLIEKAKEKLSTTDLSVSEIAYELGFEHSQSFSRLFKRKTSVSPLAFRASFN